MVNAAILGDRDFIESYQPALKEPLVITRAAWREAKSMNIIELHTSYPPSAARGDVARDLAGTIQKLSTLSHPEIFIAELSAIEYTVLAVELLKAWRPRLAIIEIPRLHPAALAALKELSLLSHHTPIIAVYQRITPRSRKLRPLFLDAAETGSLKPGFYTFKLRRLKSYMRAWLWYYEARDTATEAKNSGVPDYLIIDLESKIAEAERLLKGSEYTIVFPSIYDIKEPPPQTLYNQAPSLLPIASSSLYHSRCYASIDVVRSKLVTGCIERKELSEEAIYLWIIKAEPIPVWRRHLPPHLEETYISYQREVEKSPYKLHIKQPSSYLEGLNAPWTVVPLYSHDMQSLEKILDILFEDLSPLRMIGSVAAQCSDELVCSQTVETAGSFLGEAIRQVIENLDKYKALVSLYKSIAKITAREQRLIKQEITALELQENIALLAWVLQANLGVDPEIADMLSINASEIAELVL